MPQQLTATVENNFTRGLITDSTGLNFPENAATDTDNCIYTIVGDVTRRLGIDYETNFTTTTIDFTNKAVNQYKWNNVGGDGLTQIVVEQVGSTLYFYRSSSATVASPLSANKLASTIDLTLFTVGGTFDPAQECQFADGNGYLFVYHPAIDPVYCTYTAGVITAAPIVIKIRDFNGIPDSLADTTRPITLSDEHSYNLTNQGWLSGNPWLATSASTITIGLGARTFTVAAGIVGVTLGDVITLKYLGTVPVYIPPWTLNPGAVILTGTVTGYTGTVMTINFTSGDSGYFGGIATNWAIVPSNLGHIGTWHTAIGNYPSNADVWWYFKTTTGVYDPATTVTNQTLNSGNAPRGYYILDAFQQLRSVVGALPSLTNTVTTKRPRTGCWFQGRNWFAGVDAQQAATGDAPYYTWTENIYFSQICIDSTDFGSCYQTNDPTSERLFGLLPTDGGVITIQGCGSIFKLFPIQNGLLVFAANGVWFITGSQGIGFSANDYTITRISAIQSISGSSFVDVQGLPYFWNEEGIYAVTPAKGGALTVEPLTVGTILSFYNDIPVSCKKLAKGAYNPIDYIIQWTYRDIEPTDVTTSYQFNRIMNYNTYNKAFFPYSLATDTNPYIHGIVYVTGPGGSTSPDPTFKYPSSMGTSFTFADEHDTAYIDWNSTVDSNYTSFFITGYKLRGQAIYKFQPQYIQMYSRTNDAASAYKIQGIWDYGNDRNSNRWSTPQLITNNLTRFNTIFRRHKIRGHGFALQFKVSSADGLPFDIQGWAVVDTVNQGT